MKCFLLADNRPELLATLEPILKHWGYRVLAASNCAQVNAFLQQRQPCLIIIGMQILNDPGLRLGKAVADRLAGGEIPLLALEQGAAKPAMTPTQDILSVPVDIFSLFSFIQRFVEKHPRRNLRLRLRIPGMYRAHGNDYTLADVYSLSMHGLFLKASAKLAIGDTLSVVFPLLGHCKELEVPSTVLYTVQPEPGNNFMQGFGIGFNELNQTDQANLQKFIETRFLKEVSSCQAGVADFCDRQLKS